MKRIALVFSLFLASAALGQYVTDVYKGTLTSTGTSINSSTVAGLSTNGATGAGASGLAPGAYTIQCDAAVYFETATTSSATTSSASGTLLQAGQPWPFGVPATGDGATRVFFAEISVSGTANCKVWKSVG
jgi:hypothetical protein